MDFSKFFFLLLFVSVFSLVFVQSQNLTVQENASTCLKESKVIIEELRVENFSVNRVGDLYNETESIFNAQSALLEKTKKADFDVVFRNCKEIASLREQAFTARDAYTSLLRFYQDSISADMNASTVDATIAEINSELVNERYEKVPQLVDNAYEQISLFRSENTRFKLLYKNTATGIKGFFINNWKTISLVLVFLFISYFSFRKPIKKKVLNHKIDKLNFRKKILKDLIKKAQKDYFQDGSISQSVFEIKMKNFGQLVRDIDRQIPLLNEELLRLESKRSKNGTV